MKRTKKLFCMGLALALLLSLTACGGSPSDTPAGERTDVVYCISTDLMTLDPTESTDQINSCIIRQMYDTLIAKDNDGNFVPRLAVDWSVSDDGLVYTFKLREDAVCHDGSAVTSEDVVYSLNRAIHSTVLAATMCNMEEAVATGEYTVELHMSAPYAAVYDVLAAYSFISSHNTTDYATAPIGTGPYKYVSYQSGDSLVLTAADKYYRGDPAIKDLTFKVITDNLTAVAALQAGEVDFITHMPLSVKEMVESDSSLVWHQTNFRGQVYVIMNCEKGPFTDLRLRKAVQYGIDKDAMLLGGSEGQGKVMKTFWPETITASPEAAYVVPYSYDMEKARAYLDEYKADKGVDTVSVSIIAPDTATYLNPATTLLGILQEIGFDATLNQVDRSTFFATAQSDTYEIAVIGTSWPIPDADSIYVYNRGGYNCLSRYADETSDALWDAGRNTLDVEERTKIYSEVQSYIDENAFEIPLYQYDNAVAFRADLGGVDMQNDMYQHFVFDWHW